VGLHQIESLPASPYTLFRLSIMSDKKLEKYSNALRTLHGALSVSRPLVALPGAKDDLLLRVRPPDGTAEPTAAVGGLS
jgi:hypothetical protein